MKGKYIWPKKFFNVIRISFRWHKLGPATRAPVLKKANAQYKFNKINAPVKVLNYWAKAPFWKNYLQQLNSLNYESFVLLKSRLSQPNFYKKIVEFYSFKKRTTSPPSVSVGGVQGLPNFLFRIRNILNFYTLEPKAYEYLIKYPWTQKGKRRDPDFVLTKFRNQARIFGTRLGASPNTSFIIWKIFLDLSRAKLQLNKMIINKKLAGGDPAPVESYSLAKRAAIFLASPLGKTNKFLSVFDKKTKGQTKSYLQKSYPIYQNIWFQDYEKSNQNTYFLQRPISFPFQWIQKGDLLSDCSSSLKGELALGKNLLVAYMPWEGYNFEDAVLINEKVLSKYTSLHIEKYDLEIAESGLEKITYHIPGISTKNLQKLDPNGVVKIGSWVTEGDILVGRILPIPTETQNLLTHEKLLYDIVVFGQKETQIQERCLRVPQGVSGRIIRISYTYRIKHQEKENGTSHQKKIYPSKEILKNPSGELEPGRARPIEKNSGAPLRGAKAKPKPSLKKELSAQRAFGTRLVGGVGRSPDTGLFKIPFFVQNLYCYLGAFGLPSDYFGCPSYLEQKKGGVCQKTEKLGFSPAKVPKMMKTVILQEKAPVFLRWFRRYKSFLKTYFWVIKTKIFGEGSPARSGASWAQSNHLIKCNNKIFCWNRFINNDRYQKGLKPAKAQFFLIRTSFVKNKIFLTNQRINFMNIHKRNFRRVGELWGYLLGNGTAPPHTFGVLALPTSFKKNQNQFRKQSQTKLFKTKKRNLKNIWKSHDSSSTLGRSLQFKPLSDRWAGRTSASLRRGPDNFETTLSYKKIHWQFLGVSAPPRRDFAETKAPFINSLKKITIYIAEKREFQIGDKISGRHGNKGIISQIFSNSDMPYLSNGCTLDVLLNPLGVPSRMNVGQIFECLLGFTGKIFHTKFQVLCFDEIYGYESSRSFIYSKLFEICKKTRQKWLLSKKTPGKFHLFDGRNGQLFDQSIMVGSTYLMKLIHVVDEKIHARGTGPYSLITQQPLRGRAKHGGQRLGEMEVWALQGFGSAYTLQELLTVKSDDLHGRNQVMQTLLKNTPLRFGTPESLRVVLRELQCLCLDLQLFDKDKSWGSPA